ncbi:MAG: hypothetical protein LBH96_01820 [Candidatus Peribacteria bacterium]|nr:hypothetical protein [Candidatus Peribacteria bacterium]
MSRHSEEEDKALAEPNNEESLYIKKSSAYKDSSPRTLNPSALNDSIKNRIYTKHFIVIQNGCDNYCSFCLTVLKRGQHRNRDLQDIINEIHQIEAQGGKEIVIT